MKWARSFFGLILGFSSSVCAAAPAEVPPPRSAIPRGSFSPLYGGTPSGRPVFVEPFSIDRYPVTNLQFKRFVASSPQWSKKEPSALLSDDNYLKHWNGRNTDAAPSTAELAAPVTNVSWYAASEYCAAQGGRLPSILEWEYVAAASETAPDASRDPKFVQQLLQWYGEAPPARELGPVGRRMPNYWGVYDLHGLIWEWTEDFNSIFVSGDNRRDGEVSKNMFCGDGAAGAADRANYAAFMRYAFRSSLRANYTAESLGFRCAYDE